LKSPELSLIATTFSMSASDYGFELLSQTPFELDAGAWREVLAATPRGIVSTPSRPS
jgi:hypothetical protein